MPNVLVTGGSRGIGLGIVSRLAASGFSVIAVARGMSGELHTEMAASSLVRFEAADLADIDGLAALVRRIRRAHGPIFGLVNNAGIGTQGLLATMPNGDIERLLRINVLSPTVLTKYVVRDMMAEGAGRIVNLSSIIATTGYNGPSVYAASKAATVGFTRSLAREVGRLGITVNAVAPGFVDTAMTGDLTTEDRERVAKRSALRRLSEVADVANAVLFLLGEGGRNITGTVMTVDAGSTA